MRISDWSSDVCSSDLIERERGRFRRVAAIKVADQRRVQISLARKRRPIGIHPAPKRAHHLAYMLADDEIADADLAQLLVHVVDEAAGQIGRASCRDRVCQSV